MLNIQQISDAISDLRRYGSIEDFERWLRRESRNVHSWGSESLVQAVLAVEAVLSECRFAGMQDAVAQQELANAVRPFVPKVEIFAPKVSYRLDYSLFPAPVGAIGASSILNPGMIAFGVPGLYANTNIVASIPLKKTASAIVEWAAQKADVA